MSKVDLNKPQMSLTEMLRTTGREMQQLAEHLSEAGRRLTRREMTLAETAINSQISCVMDEATFFAMTDNINDYNSSVEFVVSLMELKNAL